MARTQRRRAARVAHHAQESRSRATHKSEVASRLSEDDWLVLSDTLNGLLHVEFPSPFTDLQLRCPKEAWLVVELDRIPTNATNLRQQLLRVLLSLTRLLTHAETVRPWSDLYETFWTRVLTSDMVQQPSCRDELDIHGFARFVEAKGTHVALQWRGRSLDPNQVIDPLDKWLQTVVDVPSGTEYMSAHVALRFENCQLTPKSIKRIHQLLRIPVGAREETFLCEPSTLRELSFSSNILHAHLLHDLEMLLQDPTTRRVDGIKLDSTVPGEAHQTPAFTAAFSRTIAAAVHAKAMSPTTKVDDRGVTLSLGDCTLFRAAHVDALAEVLVHATRPLRALSLADWHIPDWAILERVGRLLVRHLPTATEAFDVDISCLREPESGVHADRWMMNARAELVKDAALAAHAAGKALTCRPLHFAEAHHDGDEEITLSATRYYDVRNVMDCGCCEIVTTPATTAQEEIRCNVEPDSVANVCIDGVCVLREGSSGLIADRCQRESCDHEQCTSITTLAAGLVARVARVARLSVRHNRWHSQEYSSWQAWLSWSLELQELNGEGCHDLDHFFSTSNSNGFAATCASLQVLNAADCRIGSVDQGARGRFSVRPVSPHTTLHDVLASPLLWSLRFAGNTVGVAELEALHSTLRASNTLTSVDLRRTGIAHLMDTDTQRSACVAKIQALLQDERISAAARDAFLLVAQRRATANNSGNKSLPRDVTASILAFAGAGERPRVVYW